MKYSGTLLILLSLSGIVFFSTYSKSEYAAHFFFLSLAVMIPGVFLLYKFQKKKTARKLRLYRAPVDKFKKRAVKIEVPLNECYPVTKQQINGMPISKNYRLQFYKSLYSKEYFINETPDNEYSIAFKHNGNLYFSTPIPLDPEEIIEEMRIKKSTRLYVNPENSKEYYFDIEFLSEE